MKKKVKLVLAISLILLFSSSTAMAQPQSIPNGPWLQPEQYVNLSSLFQPDTLNEKLHEIADQAVEGRMELELIGSSAGFEWPMYVVKFGSEDEDKAKILIDSQIHGNEPLGTEALVEMIKELATSNSSEVIEILDNVVVWVIPMLNRDGATIFERDTETYRGDAQTRQNVQDWTPEEWGLPNDCSAPWYHRDETTRGTPGYDINRDAHPHLFFDLDRLQDQHSPCVENQNWGGQPGFYVTPEARALRNTFRELMPDVYINHHHRGSNVISEDDNRRVFLQIYAQFVPLDRVDTIIDDSVEYSYSLSEESLELSKKVNALVYKKLQRGKGNSPFSTITKYPRVEDYYGGEGLPGTTLASFSMNGAAVMLYEVTAIGQKKNGMLIRQSYIGIWETLLGLANGDLYDVDPDVYDTIPEAGPRIGNPRL
ncbi:hypothetical protein DSCA_20690 [Desulfosarcina alkanivorans]|uniref:Peptidase M14 domain-containing protein n=1 Tax=Desulfosarcina alkanivorans TaxID=571177 RepID=A0A5K7YJW1_9BACT|nr:M14 family zinc carboxypeptidase [Desulfosarcina alkanivorans]BBO68139.1 hypothetical protein DSCA_20690 [Desulfosarcina alkanivorans]